MLGAIILTKDLNNAVVKKHNILSKTKITFWGLKKFNKKN
jgi:hypothetical protein